MDNEKLYNLLKHISPRLRNALNSLESSVLDSAEEIHLSLQKPAIIAYNGGFRYIPHENQCFICDQKTITETFMLICENSVYAVGDKISNGFITISGGHRAGVCGTAVMKSGAISTIKNVSSINIRISREIFGVANKVIHKIVESEKIKNTLIISPPKCGKTTLLRDISRVIGEKHRVAVIDERSEIASVFNGIPQNDVGMLTDVFDSCPKHLAIPTVIRSMAPEIIITDELGTKEDVDALNYASTCGVNVISTIHGKDVYDVFKRKIYSDLIDYFDIFITLSNKKCTGTVENIVTRDELDI